MIRETMSQIPDRLQGLRAAMQQHGLSHYLIPSSDEHINEYLPPWGERRPFISGFTGSAGDALVGLEDAWLFTDGRYHLQASLELQGSTFQLSKVGAPGHPSLPEYLQQLARRSDSPLRVGYDPMVLPVGAAESMQQLLEAEGASFVAVVPNLVDALWNERPTPPITQLVPVNLDWVGLSVARKLENLRKALAAQQANAHVVVKLDQLAWLLNLRSKEDIPFNPVFEGYGYVDQDSVHLFLHGGEQRLPASIRADIPGLVCHTHGEFLNFLNGLEANTAVSLDPSCTTMGVKKALIDNPQVKVIQQSSPIETAKACKTESERLSMKRANLRASAVKTRALQWVKSELQAGQPVTERRFQEHIESLYTEMEDYWGLSFNTISAAGEHGAIMHYGSADDTPLKTGDLFLIDSGTQVGGGTTDDTRTIPIGAPTAEQRRLYTLVLKCHIAAAGMVFPAGTPGTAIDAICRSPIWAAGLNFDHGTGHGVGCFLNVHEGPFALSERERKPYAVAPLHEGMVTSIEPGYYKPGWGGIRLENLYLMVEDRIDENGQQWLRFEPLTFIPFEGGLIDHDALNASEKAWLENYNRRVKEELAKELSAEELAAI